MYNYKKVVPQDWVIELKPGDYVFVCNRNGLQQLKKVQEITDTGNIKVGNDIYLKDGKLRGRQAWDDTHIEKATPERFEQYTHNQLITKAKKLLRDNINNITVKQAKIIIAVLEE